MKKMLFLLAAGLMAGALIIGCGNEKPWSPDPARPLQLNFVAGPADTVSYGATISFSWTSKGGNGQVEYEYRMGSAGNWSTPSTGLTNVTFANIIAGNTFYVRATDAAADQLEISRQFWVGAQGTDTTPPTVGITASPVEGSFVATGSNVSFTWAGSDVQDGDNLLYWYSFADLTSDTSSATTVTLTNVAAGTDTFTVYAMDNSGNVSAPALVWFIIKNASILYVDDYEWLDLNGNRDMVKERDQKQFYRDALEGYAIAEWDISLQGMPDSADLVVGGVPAYSTIVFCSDTNLGSSDGTWWWDVGNLGGGVLRYYLENGGQLLATGAWVLLDLGDYDPNNGPTPNAGDFEFDWFGIDSTAWCYDYWSDFTWVVKDSSTTLVLPDSMKIDVAKNGDQVDYAVETPGLRDDATVTNEVIYRWGLDIDGGEPSAYNHPIGHITSFIGTPRTAMLNFDTYSMPLEGIQLTFRSILTLFGE